MIDYENTSRINGSLLVGNFARTHVSRIAALKSHIDCIQSWLELGSLGFVQFKNRVLGTSMFM